MIQNNFHPSPGNFSSLFFITFFSEIDIVEKPSEEQGQKLLNLFLIHFLMKHAKKSFILNLPIPWRKMKKKYSVKHSNKKGLNQKILIKQSRFLKNNSRFL